MLLAASVLMIQLVSVAYGVGAGASIQSAADHSNVTSILEPSAENLNPLYTTILSEYMVFVVGIGMLISSVLIYKNKSNIANSEARGYVFLNASLTLIYTALFFIIPVFFVNIIKAQIISVSNYYYLAVYLSIIMALSIDSYIILSKYINPSSPHRRKNLAIDPSKPYTNLLRIKDEIFSRLIGNVFIVDKHMNSEGIENFSRLFMGNENNVPEVKILTSKEMLDARFSRNYRDCKTEAENYGTRISVFVMSDEDAVSQHERFVFDDKNAYKVPPFNIMHKKSEHITRLNLNDARRRFNELQKRSIKYENFVSKNGTKPK
jgi:hypothetical protein